MSSILKATVENKTTSVTTHFKAYNKVCHFWATRYASRSYLAMSEMPFCLSNAHVNCDETKETCVHVLIAQERSMHLVLQREVFGPN